MILKQIRKSCCWKEENPIVGRKKILSRPKGTARETHNHGGAKQVGGDQHGGDQRGGGGRGGGGGGGEAGRGPEDRVQQQQLATDLRQLWPRCLSTMVMLNPSFCY